MQQRAAAPNRGPRATRVPVAVAKKSSGSNPLAASPRDAQTSAVTASKLARPSEGSSPRQTLPSFAAECDPATPTRRQGSERRTKEPSTDANGYSISNAIPTPPATTHVQRTEARRLSRPKAADKDADTRVDGQPEPIPSLRPAPPTTAWSLWTPPALTNRLRLAAGWDAAAATTMRGEPCKTEDDDGRDMLLDDDTGFDGTGWPQLGKYQSYRLRKKQELVQMEQLCEQLLQENHALHVREKKLLYLLLLAGQNDEELHRVRAEREILRARLSALGGSTAITTPFTDTVTTVAKNPYDDGDSHKLISSAGHDGALHLVRSDSTATELAVGIEVSSRPRPLTLAERQLGGASTQAAGTSSRAAAALVTESSAKVELGQTSFSSRASEGAPTPRRAASPNLSPSPTMFFGSALSMAACLGWDSYLRRTLSPTKPSQSITRAGEATSPWRPSDGGPVTPVSQKSIPALSTAAEHMDGPREAAPLMSARRLVTEASTGLDEAGFTNDARRTLLRPGLPFPTTRPPLFPAHAPVAAMDDAVATAMNARESPADDPSLMATVRLPAKSASILSLASTGAGTDIGGSETDEMCDAVDPATTASAAARATAVALGSLVRASPMTDSAEAPTSNSLSQALSIPAGASYDDTAQVDPSQNSSGGHSLERSYGFWSPQSSQERRRHKTVAHSQQCATSSPPSPEHCSTVACDAHRPKVSRRLSTDLSGLVDQPVWPVDAKPVPLTEPAQPASGVEIDPSLTFVDRVMTHEQFDILRDRLIDRLVKTKSGDKTAQSASPAKQSGSAVCKEPLAGGAIENVATNVPALAAENGFAARFRQALGAAQETPAASLRTSARSSSSLLSSLPGSWAAFIASATENSQTRASGV